MCEEVVCAGSPPTYDFPIHHVRAALRLLLLFDTVAAAAARPRPCRFNLFLFFCFFYCCVFCFALRHVTSRHVVNVCVRSCFRRHELLPQHALFLHWSQDTERGQGPLRVHELRVSDYSPRPRSSGGVTSCMHAPVVCIIIIIIKPCPRDSDTLVVVACGVVGRRSQLCCCLPA